MVAVKQILSGLSQKIFWLVVILFMTASIPSLSTRLFSNAQAFGASNVPTTELWQDLVSSHISETGGVSYTGFEKDWTKLKKFIASYETIKTSSMSEDARKASYINLYNGLMINNILRYAKENKIATSSTSFLNLKINKINVPGGNIWSGDYKIKFSGQMINLDDIEHKLIRGKDVGKLSKHQVAKLDPRIHTAVNCAALSCPRVRKIAYTEKNVNKLLNENIKEYVSSERYFRKTSDSQMRGNSIVYWYYSDFDEYGQKVLKNGGAGDYLAKFLLPSTKDLAWKKKHFRENFNDRSKFSLKLTSSWKFDYNWKINDVRNTPQANN